MYKAISESLENCKIINCIELNIILNCINGIIKLYIRENIDKLVIFAPKEIVVQHFTLRLCNMYNNLQYLLTVNKLMFKWIFMQHIFILSDSLSEKCVGCNFIHSKYHIVNVKWTF